MNKKVFTVDGLELAIKKVTAKIRIDSQLIRNKEWKKAVDGGSMLQRNLDKEAEKLGLWGPEVRQEIESVSDELRNLERKLLGGANSFNTKDEAKNAALHMRELRSKLIDLNRSKDELYPYTAESFAEEARTKFIISQCLIDNNTGNPYYKTYDDFLAHSDDAIVQEATVHYFELLYSDIGDIQGEWTENKWLKSNGYTDDKYRLVNKDGKLIDNEGFLVNEDGRYVDEAGNFVDKSGNKVDESGRYVVEYVDFPSE